MSALTLAGMVGWIAVVIGCICQYMLGNKNISGWLVGLIACVFWLFWVILMIMVTDFWSQSACIASVIMAAFFDIRGYFKWLQLEKKEETK